MNWPLQLRGHAEFYDDLAKSPSYVGIGLPTLAADLRDASCEIERLLGLFKELRAAWFKGGDLNKDHVSQEALRIFIAAESVNQQSAPEPKPKPGPPPGWKPDYSWGGGQGGQDAD